MPKVSVDLESPSPYIENDSHLHRFKRNLSYSFAIRKIRRRFSSGDAFSLLEVGTGSGFFLACAHQKFPGAALSGIEYDPRLLEVTQRRAPFANCMQGNAETFDLRPASFDVVASFQVIEHLYDPQAMVARVRSHLKTGGIFIVTTPNPGGVGARFMGEKWHAFRDDHVSLKGIPAWTHLIESCGFKTLYRGSTFFTGIPFMNRFPLGLFNWALLVAFGSAPWRHGESFVGVFEAV